MGVIPESSVAVGTVHVTVAYDLPVSVLRSILLIEVTLNVGPSLSEIYKEVTTLKGS